MFSFQGTWWNLLEIPGGDKRDRTADLLNAIQALSQLSYTPMEPEVLDFTGLPGY
mgnify:CR=1 FL=1